MPFDDLSPDKSLGYLGDGVSEDIIGMLSRFTDLSVTARNSSFVYKGKPIDIRQVGHDLNVDYALEGSVRKEADQIRITAQLVDTKTGEHVWAEHYDKAGNDPSALQDEATEKIVRAITGDFGVIKKAQYHDAWAKDTASLSEYDYYLRTHDLINTASSKEATDRAARVAEEGLTKYPDSNLVKIQLAWAHFSAVWSNYSDDIPADLRKTGELTRSVLAHDNLSPQVKKLAHWLFAWVLASEADFLRALHEADTAVAFGPYDGIMHAQLSQLLMTAGEVEKGMEWNELAHPQDPGGVQFQNYNRGLGLRLLGKYEDSIAAFKQSFYPEGDTPLNIAIALVRLGRIDEAKAEVKARTEERSEIHRGHIPRNLVLQRSFDPRPRGRRSRQGRPAGEVTRRRFGMNSLRTMRRRPTPQWKATSGNMKCVRVCQFWRSLTLAHSTAGLSLTARSRPVCG